MHNIRIICQLVINLRDTYESRQNEPRIKVMLGKCEHRNADVGEDEVLRQEIEQLEYLLGALTRIVRQVVVRVVRLTDAAEQNGYNAGQLRHLGDQERTVGHQHEQRRLENGEVANASEFSQVCLR